MSYGPVRATWTLSVLPPSALIVPPIQWQLHQMRMCFAVSDVSVESLDAARMLTRSPGLMSDSCAVEWSLPLTIFVSELTATVTACPLSWPSCGPVQSTFRLTESLPTAVTEPANQCTCALAAGVGAAVAPRGSVAKTMAAAAMRPNLRIVFLLRFLSSRLSGAQPDGR